MNPLQRNVKKNRIFFLLILSTIVFILIYSIFIPEFDNNQAVYRIDQNVFQVKSDYKKSAKSYPDFLKFSLFHKKIMRRKIPLKVAIIFFLLILLTIVFTLIHSIFLLDIDFNQVEYRANILKLYF
jgi:hypothetical protein